MNKRSRYPDVGHIRTNNAVVCEVVVEDGLPFRSHEVYSLSGNGRIVGLDASYRVMTVLPACEGSVMRLGPDLSLRIIGQNRETCFYIYATPERFGARAIVLYYRLRRRVQRTGYLLVHLAEIWGLAEVDPATIPNWRDLLIVRRFRK
jgi:hypothetical protein